jgi:lipoprotein-anchoring transpeptidase ErfK/SrfK
MKVLKLLGFLASLVAGIYVGIAVLPYYLSGQQDIDYSRLSGLYNPLAKTGFFHNQEYTAKYIPPVIVKNPPNILGVYRADKRIEVDLTNQRLYAYEDNNKIYDFPVSSGLWNRTPTGEFTIWIKLRYTKMEGGNRAWGTYYNLPNVPYTMFFANADIPTWRGFGIHGTYWHSNFGHPMSHGCINMKTGDAEKIYYWVQPDLPDGQQSVRATPDNSGTRVIIYGIAPDA